MFTFQEQVLDISVFTFQEQVILMLSIVFKLIETQLNLMSIKHI